MVSLVRGARSLVFLEVNGAVFIPANGEHLVSLSAVDHQGGLDFRTALRLRLFPALDARDVARAAVVGAADLRRLFIEPEFFRLAQDVGGELQLVASGIGAVIAFLNI